MLTAKDLEKYHQAAERILNAMDNSPVPISWHEMDRMALQSVIAKELILIDKEAKVRRGETMIFFIRKKEEPDKPYYTLEWRGKVIQCRGSHNCDMTSEVRAFVQIFQEKMMEYESKPKRQRKAG